MSPKVSMRDQAIYAAPGWDVYDKGRQKIARIKNVPGCITGYMLPLQGTPRKTHPFIDMAYYRGAVEDNNSTNTIALLERAHSFDEFVSILKENGYKVVRDPNDKSWWQFW